MGAMGVHYVKGALVGDGKINPRTPEAMVYEPRHGRLRLVAVEYVVFPDGTDKLYDEAQSAKPSDLPSSDLVAGGKTFKVTNLFPLSVGNELDLVVKYQSPDVSNTTQTFQDNMTVMKALIAKYPELREAFGGIVARAVEPSGRDYGSLMAMKDIK